MDSFSLIESVIKGKLDTESRLPFSFWRHFPQIDRDPIKNAKAHIDFQKKYKCDFIKYSAHGRFPVVDFGCKVGDETDSITGSTRCQQHAVNSLEDWENIDEVDVLDGEYGRCLKTTKILGQKFHQDVPIFLTIFLPLMVADKLSNNFKQQLLEDKQLVQDKLSVITKVVNEFCKAGLDEGADGLFLATQQASNDFWTKEDFGLFKKFDEKILKNFENKNIFKILHLHGNGVFFDWAVQQPVSFINWHSTETEPKMKDALSNRAHMNGLDKKIFVDYNSAQIVSYLDEFINNLEENRKKSLISPGCVIPLNYKEENLQFLSNYFVK
ncbi:MAG: hypothetical protein HeimC3_44450 [Candidatus Heimdallarchaeota archaeon LC_3]|nr:MAG: hypothetical protein HeimC3_44450 [Candidatus Heimdallarchaeota archaeon LC_3]